MTLLLLALFTVCIFVNVSVESLAMNQTVTCHARIDAEIRYGTRSLYLRLNASNASAKRCNVTY